MNQEAVLENKKSIYIVWIIPFVAIILAAWMIFKHYDEKGYEVIVTFNNGSGMSVGKTALMYNGIKVGEVSGMAAHPGDISLIDVTITVDKQARGVAKEGNVFWKVEPKLSLTEISGLSTILSGVYIEVMPNTKNPDELMNRPAKFAFTAVEDAPINIFNNGLIVKLHADKYDIKVGAPIMYKKMNIGKVLDAKLVLGGVNYLIQVEKKYAKHLKVNSKFWKVSGVEVRASLAGLRVEMDSLASLVAGGIGVNSPEDGISANEKSEYNLYENHKAIDLENNYITLVSNNGYNIDIKSAHIFFKGSDAGNIISLDYNPNTDKTTFKIKLKSKFRHLANKDAHFWIVEPSVGLTGINGLGAIAQGAYINFETSSHSKEMKNKFALHVEAPKVQGKHFKLVSNNGHNLKNGINVIYKNIIVGSLRDSKLSKDNKDVIFDIVIDNKYKNIVNDSSAFYIQDAIDMGASFDGIYLNIGSVTSMVNGGIVLQTNDLKASKTHNTFVLEKNYDAYMDHEYLSDGGKTFKLIADDLGSLKDGSVVSYKGIKVGKVVGYIFNKETSKIELEIYIKKEFTDQVNSATNFFNISGIKVKAGFSGVEIQTGSLENIVTGGIAFKTPINGEKIDNLHNFTLYKDEDAVDEKYVEISFFTSEESSIKKDSSIMYKSVVVGQVIKKKLVDEEIVVTAIIKDEHKNLLAQDSIFWVEDVKVSLDGIKNPSSILSGAFIKVLKGQSTQKAKRFPLSVNEPVATLNQKGLRVLVTGSKLSSLKIGSPVFYRQIKIGSVEAYSLSHDSKGVDLKLFIDECYSYLVRENSIFYNATAMGMDVSLFGVKISTETISTMINGGITMVTPDDANAKAQEFEHYKLYNTPQEEWLEYAPELINNMSTCREEI